MNELRCRRLLLLLLVALITASAHAQRRPTDQSHKREIIRRYETMLEQNPEEGFALTKLLDILGSGPSLDEAIARYRKRVTSGTNGYSSRMLLGHLLRAKKSFDEAIRWYREAAKLKPREGAAYVSVARTLALQKKTREALAEYEKAARMIRDKSARARVIRAAVRLAVRLKDLKKARELYQRVIAQDPSNVFLRVSYAELLVREREYKAALVEWRAIAGRYRGDPKFRLRAQVEIAELTAKIGKTDEALKLYRAALARIPAGNWLRRRVREKIIELYRSKNKLKELIALTLKERKTFDTLVQLAALYEEVGDDKNAEKYYRLALRKNSRHLETHQALIKLLSRGGEKEKLFKAYAEMARLTGGDWKADIKLAELFFLHNEKDKALKLLAKASKKHPREAQLHVRIIDLYFQHGGTDAEVKKRVEAEYRLLIRLEPKKTTHLVGLGEFYWTENDTTRAQAEWRKILKVVAVKADGHFQLAQVFADHKMRSEAMRHFEEAVRLAPANLKFRRGFAQELERSHRHDRAVEQWEQVLRLSTTIKGAQRKLLVAAEARRRMIHLLAQQQTLRGRMVEFERRFKATPPDKNAGYLLGMGYAKYKEMKLAEQVFKRLLTLDPKDLTALVALQELYIQRNELEKAVAILERIAEIDKSRAREIWQKIAVYLLNLNKKSDAVKYAKMAVEFDPSNPEANARLGKIYWQLGRVEAAIEAYKRAIRFNPRNFTFYFELARIYQAEQRTADELDLMQRIVREASDEPQILMAGRRLFALVYREKRLAEQESVLVGLIQSRPNLKVYRKLLIELYHLQVTDILGRYPSIDAARSELRRVGEQGVAVLKEALTHQDVRIRTTAIDVLRHTGRPGATTALIRALDSTDVITRFQAAIALGEIGDENAVPALTKKLTDSKYDVRRAVVWALGQIRHESATKVLVRLIRDGAIYGDLRSLAFLGLGNQGGSAAVEGLLSGLRSSAHNDKLASALALGYLREKRAFGALREQLNTTLSWRVRKVVIWALGRLAEPRAFAVLLSGLWDTRSELREISAWALLRLSPLAKPQPTRSYRQMLRSFVSFHDGRLFARYDYLGLSSELIDARPAAVVALLRRFQKPLISALRNILTSSDPTKPRRALELLDFDSTAFSLGVITAVVPRPARHKELQALLRSVVVALKEPLERLTSSQEALLREQAVQVLGKLHDPSLRGLFTRLGTSDSSPNVRRAAIRALFRYGDRSVLATFTAILRKQAPGDWQLRAALARSLRSLRWSEALPLLGKLLRDDVFLVRAEALETLLKMGGTDGKSVISSALSNTSKPVVVLDIISVIADRRLAQYTAELRRLTQQDAPEEVRSAARAALEVLLQRPLQHRDI